LIQTTGESKRPVSRLSRGNVTVILVSGALELNQDAEDFAALLDAGERARSRLIADPRARRTFEVAHAVTRLVLARELRLRPEALVFTLRDGGKPDVVNSSDLHWNLSHSGEHAVLAYAYGRDVGIDIERVRDLDVRQLAERFFTSREAAALSALSGDEQRDGFFRCWTRKESFVKALGNGLSIPLDAFESGCEPQPSPLVIEMPADPRGWTIADLPAPPGYVAALTVEGEACEIVHASFPAP
jgi:4'-phosphopantetheinyl transferase